MSKWWVTVGSSTQEAHPCVPMHSHSLNQSSVLSVTHILIIRNITACSVCLNICYNDTKSSLLGQWNKHYGTYAYWCSQICLISVFHVCALRNIWSWCLAVTSKIHCALLCSLWKKKNSFRESTGDSRNAAASFRLGMMCEMCGLFSKCVVDSFIAE